MADTTTVTIPLDVLDKYSALVKESLSGDSVYIRAKETINDLVKDGSLDDAKKAEVISSVIGGAVNGITNAAMSGALDWAKYEKELALKKLELDKQLLILDQELALKTAQAEQVEVQNRLALVESKRMYGAGTFDVTTGALLSINEIGSKLTSDIALVDQQTANAAVEENLLTSKITESEVAIHKVIADTYVNYGSYTFVQTADGVTSVTPTHGSYQTLSGTQKEIAIEQGKGYTYNAWANALTGSASMLGTAIASGDFSFASGTSGDILLRTVINCANNLAVSDGTDAEAIPVDKVTVPTNITA